MTASKIGISQEHLSIILEELESNRPFEACGVLLGINEGYVASIKRVVPVKNSRRTQYSFELDSTEFYRIWNDAEKEGMDVVGIYHTHPANTARPSDRDKKSMRNFPLIWIIAGNDGVFAYRFVKERLSTVHIV
ncbi:Mov34/MPN/PAD-1 family protein [Methanohalophilus mahii]|uniref:Mov34/MPN/PAD-1 family protein n=1 Tax=Methanohalophilus mahii (strain ATCC 35705 / DSM 5219 / SLP) TaxID=547558 RepID=D5EAL8_METMS|nr:M67 family metallopeptidase [Methanohalophilus mahii]ADE36219.1 Mov34/MPN/PAD-1 family protein [Methanohalophilus mahii DSM 5219]